MSDAKTHISECGEFVYPHLTKPDTRFDEAGLYSVTLKLPEAQAKNMISLFDKAVENSIAEAETNNKGKKIKVAPKPHKIEEGNAFFKFKMKATGKNRKTQESFSQRPAVLDAKKNPIPSTTSIWGGTKGKIAFTFRPYYVPALGAGITAQLKAVQILELVEGGAKQLNLFEEEEGFEATSQAESNSNESSEVQTSSDF
jgi:hypothetical protein